MLPYVIFKTYWCFFLFLFFSFFFKLQFHKCCHTFFLGTHRIPHLGLCVCVCVSMDNGHTWVAVKAVSLHFYRDQTNQYKLKLHFLPGGIVVGSGRVSTAAVGHCFSQLHPSIRSPFSAMQCPSLSPKILYELVFNVP